MAYSCPLYRASFPSRSGPPVAKPTIPAVVSSATQKMGISCKQLHSYDYGGPYAGFKGAINFYREIDRMVNMKVWSFTKPPWDKEDEQRERAPVAAD